MKELLEEMAFLLETGTFVYPTSLLTKIKTALAQPAQKPVRWWDEERDVLYTHCTHDTDDYHKFKRTVPLYATPQRTWVELAPEDRLCARYMLDAPEGIEAVIDYITAKLKELNT